MSGGVGRATDSGERLADFAGDILVRCPRCEQCAHVRGVGSHRRLTCAVCGHSDERIFATSAWGDARDPWFREPLYLTTRCAGHELWAFNAAHLTAMRGWIAAPLRQRSNADHTSMLEKLPSWMTAAENREEVATAIDRLLERAAGA